MLDVLLFVLIVVLVIVLLFSFGLKLKENDTKQLDKYFRPKH
ncbi:MAG: hypothetical protein WC462_00815 [archaeon]